MQKRLFFNDLFSVGIEAYIELLIASIMNLRAPLFHLNGEWLGTIISCCTTAITLVVMPLAYAHIFR